MENNLYHQKKWGFWVLVIVYFTPIPFGSARPLFQSFDTILISVASLLYFPTWVRKIDSAEYRYQAKLCIQFLVIFFALFILQYWVVPGQEIFTETASDLGIFGFSVEYRRDFLGVRSIGGHVLLFWLCVNIYSNTSRIFYFFKFSYIYFFIYIIISYLYFFSGNELVLWYKKTFMIDVPSGTFINRNNFAAFIGIAVQFFLFILIRGQSGHLNRYNGWLPSSTQTFVLGIMALYLISLAQSRGAFISTSLGLIIQIIIYLHRSGKGYRYTLLAGIATFTSIAVVLVGSGFQERLIYLRATDQRFQLYPIVIQMIGEHPLVGVGLGAFEDVFRLYRTENIYLYFDRAHSDILELVLSVGLPMAFIMLLFFSRYFYGYKIGRITDFSYVGFALGLVVQLFSHATIDFPLSIPGISIIATAFAAVILVAHRDSHTESNEIGMK